MLVVDALTVFFPLVLLLLVLLLVAFLLIIAAGVEAGGSVVVGWRRCRILSDAKGGFVVFWVVLEVAFFVPGRISVSRAHNVRASGSAVAIGLGGVGSTRRVGFRFSWLGSRRFGGWPAVANDKRFACLYSFPVFHGENNFPGLGACIGPNDPVLRHEVNQSRGPAVANSERPLKQREAPSPFANDNVDRLFVEFIPLAKLSQVAGLLIVIDFQIHQLVDKFLFAGADRIDNGVYLLVGQIRALAAQHGARARPEKQHISIAQQFLGAHLVENDSAIRSTCDLERKSRGQVGLDQAGDDVHRRLLRGENQVDPDSSALLRQANNMLFHFLSRCHHQVGNFVSHNDDEWQAGGNTTFFGLILRLQAAVDFGFPKLIETRNVSNTRLGQQLVSLFHLLHSPSQDRLSLSHIGHDGVHQMGKPTVSAQLDHFGVDHQHPHFVRSARHQHRSNNGVEADALACSGATGDQQVGHGREVHDQGIPRNVLA